MAVHYFVGSYCEIDGGRIKLDKFGQKIDLPEPIAEIVVKGGGAILPESTFQALGFTADELKSYAYPGPRESAPADMKAKVQAAHAAFHDHKQAIEQAAAVEVSA